jgi:DNA ligase-1
LARVVADAFRRAAERGQDLPLRLSPALQRPDWASLAALRDGARGLGAEGMMLKGMTSAYGVGRRKSGPANEDLWWKWKLNPMSVDAVLIYAQRGSGRRSGVYSDYTFAVWSGPPEDASRTLVPFAKAYSGLTDEEMRQVDATIRRTTIETFGPVRHVKPTMVFELGFEGIAPSKRHKSGVATRFPRMLRWRQDKPVEEADTLAQLRALLPKEARG